VSRAKGRGRSFGALFAAALAKQRAGRAAEAAALYAQAIRADRRVAEAHNNLGCALLALGRLEDAARALAEAVALRPGYADALDTLGVVAAELGRHGDAAGYFERALAAEPAHAGAALHLGNALLSLERVPEARAAFERATALDPAGAPARNGLGVAFAEAGDERTAASHFEAALALDPGFAEAACNLGRVRLEAGDLAAATHWFERAIELEPGNGRYHFQLVRSRKAPLDPERLAAMEALCADTGRMSHEGRIEFHFALAKAYEDVQRYDDAFGQLRTGNRLKRAELAYNEASELGFLAKLERAIDRPFLDGLRTTGNPSERPVFVFGMPRCGSTLVEQILAAHPGVRGAGEIAEVGRLIAADPPPIGVGTPLAPAGESLRALAERYLEATNRFADGALRVTDKTLANFSVAPLLHVAFPNARLIHVRRDRLDTCFSCYATLFRGPFVSFSYDLGELGRYYRAYERLMAHWRAILPADRFLEVDYEAVVADLETEARRIVEFCGLPWDQACLAFHAAPRAVRTASVFQVRQPLYGSAIGRAGHFAAHLGPLVAALAAEPGQPAAV
jgi:tetratricopeptide (TPR) repeat protein